jgi:hypothetical protein
MKLCGAEMIYEGILRQSWQCEVLLHTALSISSQTRKKALSQHVEMAFCFIFLTNEGKRDHDSRENTTPKPLREAVNPAVREAFRSPRSCLLFIHCTVQMNKWKRVACFISIFII